MSHRGLKNYLRTYRLRSGLSQREVGLLLGYRKKGQVSRHEQSQTAPPLETALAYEAIFRTPVSVLFAAMHASAKQAIEIKLVAFKQGLNPGKGRKGRAIAQKLAWLAQRQG